LWLVRRAEALRESESSGKDAARQLQELIVIRNELQAARDALQSELSDALDANRELKASLDAANAALQQLKLEMENRLLAADEEIENIRFVNNIEIINYCQEQLDFKLPSELIASRTEKFRGKSQR